MSREWLYHSHMATDHVDEIISQWQRERPDVDVAGMAIIGRISRLERMIRPRLNEAFVRHDLESWEFDVLSTLRRSGDPYRMTAGQLFESMMITSGTMTNRIDRLENRGFLRRSKDPDDGRLVLVTLTEDGLDRIDAALEDHAANELSLIEPLKESDRALLVDLLRSLHVALAQADIPQSET